jgi:hypothetical protein
VRLPLVEEATSFSRLLNAPVKERNNGRPTVRRGMHAITAAKEVIRAVTVNNPLTSLVSERGAAYPLLTPVAFSRNREK